MNCTFCLSDTNKIDLKGIAKTRFIYYVCPQCHTTFVHHYMNGYRGYRMEVGKYTLLFFPLHKRFTIRFDGEDILELDHCPDIHPSKASRWLTKLLKLKAFA